MKIPTIAQGHDGPASVYAHIYKGRWCLDIYHGTCSTGTGTRSFRYVDTRPSRPDNNLIAVSQLLRREFDLNINLKVLRRECALTVKRG